LLDIYPRHQHGRAIAIWGVGVMIGPVLGPTLGGWLTETLSWRWVFYINLPVGLMAITGLSLFVKRTHRQNKLPFDWAGFALLSLSIGALQMMLDRGQSQDWFSAPEIVMEAVLAMLCFYLFVVHIMTTRRPFLNPAMFKDRNLSMGLGFMFLVGIIFLSTMAILPPFLQTLKGWPVILTGLVLAPRGLGMMLGMLVMGRLAERFDPRFLIAGGMMMIVFSLYSMSQFTLEVSQKDIIWTGFTQGLGLGSVFVPMGVITFATLDEKYRTEATALFSLVRNIGSSIGVSISFALLARNIQINHAELAAHITIYNPLVKARAIAGPIGLEQLALVDAQINQQAAMIGYLNDFRFMMAISLLAAPFILLLRSPHKKTAPIKKAAD